MKRIIWLLFLVFISIAGFQNCSKDPAPIDPPSQWSEPVLYYSNPNSFWPIRFEADVNAGTMNVVSSFSLFQDWLKYNEYSGIYLLRQEPGKELEIKKLSQDNIPSEWPSILRGRSGNLHFLWGDRRQDPDFENWVTPRPQALGYSTDVTYFKLDDKTNEPEHIYAGKLGSVGLGDILFPLSLTEDSHGNLHVVFGDTPFNVYMNRDKSGHWSSPSFVQPTVGYNNIAALPGGRLVIAYTGLNQQIPSKNDVLITYSDDDGISWSDPVIVLISTREKPSFDLQLIHGPDETLHLIWGREVDMELIPDEIWHSTSDDGGISWTEPEMIFKLDPGFGGFYSFETIIDSYGRLHFSGISLVLGAPGQESLWYSSMSPKTGQWEDLTKLDFVGTAIWSSLAFDKSANELYLFWTRRDTDTDQQVFYYTKKFIRNP